MNPKLMGGLIALTLLMGCDVTDVNQRLGSSQQDSGKVSDNRPQVPFVECQERATARGGWGPREYVTSSVDARVSSTTQINGLTKWDPKVNQAYLSAAGLPLYYQLNAEEDFCGEMKLILAKKFPPYIGSPSVRIRSSEGRDHIGILLGHTIQIDDLFHELTHVST